MLSNAARSPHKIAAIGHPIILILMLPFGALASPRRGLCDSVRRRHGCLVAALWRQEAWQDRTASAPPSRCFAVLKEMVAAAASSKGSAGWHPQRTNSSWQQLNARAQNANLHFWPSQPSGSDDRMPEQHSEKSNHNNPKNKTPRVAIKGLVVGGQPVGIAHAKLLGRPPAS
jgi:hypothetical protein